MQFTGKNLDLVEASLHLACDELHTQIATCPDIKAYAKDIAGYRKDITKIHKLLARITKKKERSS